MVDYYNSRVRKITQQGVVTTVAGNGINGAGSGYADGLGTAALFSGPLGICMDVHGNFFITDTYNYVIREMTPGGQVTTIAGTPLTNGFADGIGSAAIFYNPAGICVDGSGNLYVADAQNNRIRKIAPGGIVTTLAGSSAGDFDGPAGTARFNTPIAVCVDANGNVYVADYNNNRIRKVTPTGDVTTIAGSLAGYVDGNGTAAMLSGPSGICIDPNGNLFVAEAINGDVRMISPSGEVSTVVPAAGNNFYSLSGICIDPSGNLYLMDMYNYQVKKLTPRVTIAPDCFFTPAGISPDPNGISYLVESDSYQIRN